VSSQPELEALAARIATALATKPEHIVKHPAELKLLQELSDTELREFAGDHGWSVIRRLGDAQIQFYNDVTESGGPEGDVR
jgi:hypothetical protein